MLKERIKVLKHKLINYAGLIEEMIKRTMLGFTEKDEDILNDIMNNKEVQANDYEIEIDEMGISIIAQFQPTAKDLRTILMILRINNDLERIGDLAVNMCGSIKYLIKHPLSKKLIDTPKMTEATIKMLRESINSFVNEDTALANRVCESDNYVDDLRDKIWRDVINDMIENPSFIERGLYLMTISRNLERIADLSTNIAEDIVFMVDGDVIKHHKGSH